MKLGEKLNIIIKQNKMSINQVATEANVPPSSLYSIIQRNSTKVDVDAFIRICKVLGCKPEDFSNEILEAAGKQEQPLVTANEARLLDYYRCFNKEGQEKLIDIASDMAQLERYKKSTKAIYRAADSKDHTEHEIIEDGAGIIEKLSKFPPVTNKEDF